MTRIAISVAALSLWGLGQGLAAAQDLQRVKDLYEAAAFEDALAAAGKAPEAVSRPELEKYRVFCLIALGRDDEANEAIERLVVADPLYLPDPVETPPRVQQAFAERRQELLPDLARRMYTDAKAALDRKERERAVTGFEQLVQVIDSAGTAAALGDLRLLAAGFLDLSRALPAPEPAPTPEPVATNGGAAAPAAGTNGAAKEAAGKVVETSPRALRQDLPPWVPVDAISRRMEFSGMVRVRVNAAGAVESAEMVRPAHPIYDPELLRAAQQWRYVPATRNGVAIPAELVVEVRLRPTP